ncbi:LysE family translocator [Acinetobacter qingfengensis]|uniref:Uncharacterized protein n=1 Tax=Acinetobacter qingfengensis TaxID=1262585 RepID=A0A1E7RE00_9GAMM|nr:LysE family translocator [Acinetobacter qingfengensis]KAA8734530.1 LysE family translocator [Acinetobacter qingfengensis]OEY97568.1 hypothetical protein BJI46_09450 [Acinetobacter qingfengensis]
MLTFILIATAHFLALLSPGPDFFLILKVATTQKQYLAFILCIGIATGHLCYLVLVFFGLSLLEQYVWILDCIQIMGVTYLLYLAAQMLRTLKNTNTLSINQQKNLTESASIVQVFFEGLAISLLNPKNALFYASLISLLGQQITLYIKLFYIIWMTGIVFLWDFFLAYLFTQRYFQHIFQHWLKPIQIITAIVFIGFAIIITANLVMF